MITIIELVFIISLVCTGIYACTWEGMIFYPLVKLYDKAINKLMHIGHNKKCFLVPGIVLLFLRKPLFGCMICMSSVWTLMIWLVLGFKINWMLPVVMLAVCGINTCIVSIIKDIIPDE